MAKHLPVPRTEDPQEWREYIDHEIPALDNGDGRGLPRLPARVMQVLAPPQPVRSSLKNPAAYEGRMSAFSERVFESRRDRFLGRSIGMI